jgi:L-lactate dehydrogenase complex protein LldG
VSGSRERVLASIRRSLNRNGPVTASVATGLEQRMRSPRANLKPSYGEAPVERFVAKVEAVSGMVTRVAKLSEVSKVVEAHVKKWELSFDLVVAPDPQLESIVWSNRFQVERRAALATDQTSVTAAFAGVGETGTLVLLSGAHSPTTLNFLPEDHLFLPEDHLIVLRRSRIVTHLEDVWTLLREEQPEVPRTVNLITGPSRTGDVEQIIQEGAHGPRRLHVILLEDS